MKDLASNLNVLVAIEAVAIGTTGTGKTSAALDLQSFESAMFNINYGAITATDAVFTVLVTDGATTGGTFASVADADLVGTELAAGVAATATRADGISEKIVKKLGYIGAQRWVKIKVSSIITAGTPIAVTLLRSNARTQPVS